MSDLVTDPKGRSHFVALVVGHESRRSSQNALRHQQLIKQTGCALRKTISTNHTSTLWTKRPRRSPSFHSELHADSHCRVCFDFHQSCSANNHPRCVSLLSSLVHYTETVLGPSSSTQTVALPSAQAVARPTVSRAAARNRAALANDTSASSQTHPQVVSGTRSLKRKRTVMEADVIDVTTP